MERIQEEMVKMSQDERDRYLYLREAMAASDRVSQLQSAENRGRREGKSWGKGREITKSNFYDSEKSKEKQESRTNSR